MIYTIICIHQDNISELYIIAVTHAHVYDFLLLIFRFMHHKKHVEIKNNLLFANYCNSKLF